MSWAHLHLMLNHIPLVGMGFVTLLLLVALIRKSSEMLNVALIFVVLVSLWAIPVYLTGEPAEEVVEEQPGVSEHLIEEHEEQAELAFILTEITGVLALFSLIAGRFANRFRKGLSILTLVALIISAGVMAWTANLGGKIRHPEIRSGADASGTTYDTHDEHEEDD